VVFFFFFGRPLNCVDAARVLWDSLVIGSFKIGFSSVGDIISTVWGFSSNWGVSIVWIISDCG